MARSKVDDSKPLISVICRTMGRPELKQALASVFAQTYRPIQLVIVDAAAQGLDAGMLEAPADIDLHIVTPTAPLNRPQAANAGLDAANGQLLMFLDEDDWIANDHLDELETFLSSEEAVRAVYSSVNKTTKAGMATDEVFEQDYDALLLMRDNYIPIHAMLFERSLVDSGCRFDENLSIYEDWDFWLQLSQHTEFRHLNRVSAFYRGGGDSETSVSKQAHKYEAGHPNALAREKILNKWVQNWTGAQVNQLLGSLLYSGEIEELRKEVALSHETIRELGKEVAVSHEAIETLQSNLRDTEYHLEDAHHQLREVNLELEQLRQEHAKLNVLHERLNADVNEILSSFSWRVTAPYRYLRRHLDRYVLRPIRSQVGQAENIIQRSGEDEKVDPVILRIDSPDAEGSVVFDDLSVRGWVLHSSGPVTVTIFIDGLQFRTFQPNYPRPDVFRQYEQWEHAQNSGFIETLPLTSLHYGVHELRLHCEVISGISQSAEICFHHFPPSELYNAWVQSQYEKYQAFARQKRRQLEKANPSPLLVLFISQGPIESTRKSLLSLQSQTWQDYSFYYLGEDWAQFQNDGEIDNLLKDKVEVKESLSDLHLDNLAGNAVVVTLRSGEWLSGVALESLLYEATTGQFDLVYSDHDHIDSQTHHSNPVFTWQWAPEYLRSRNYIGDVYLTRAKLLGRAIAQGYDSENLAYGCLLDLTLSAVKVGRIPKVLWSEFIPDDGSTQDTDSADSRALQQFIDSHGLSASVEHSSNGSALVWNLETEPLVSIIIPTTGRLSLLQLCIESLIERTSYRNYEVIILDNSRGKHPEGIDYLAGKGFRIIECDEDFNWARLNNKAARQAKGELLLFLNDDVEITQADWMQELVRLAVREDIGTVGCKLFYPNGALQHAGVLIVNYGGGGVHLFHRMHPDGGIYLDLDNHVREVSANTGACLMVSRVKFESVEGFDEALAVVGNDVDFCLRLEEKNWRNVWTPRTQLIHHESISRSSTVPRENELYLWERWGEKLENGDPYFNPNLDSSRIDCKQQIDLHTDKILERLPRLSGEVLPPENQTDPGVNVIGYIRADMGLGEAVRADARALEAAQIDFGIINFERGNPARMTNLSWVHREINRPKYDINLIHINGDHLELTMQELPDYFFINRYNVAYWAWELESIPDDWLPSIDGVDEIWVPSQFVAAAVRKVCTKPVTVIPHNVSLSVSDDINRSHFGIPEKAFTFLAMYDTRSTARRKNPNAAIRAFKNAFRADDSSVCLVLNLNNASISDVGALQSILGDYDNIRILDSNYSRSEVESLLGNIDCYVSLHRAEGFGLGPAEAMSLGKPCILTNWSGNTDYMTDDNCMAVDYRLEELKLDFGPYKAGQRWAEADIEQASRFMKQIATDQELAKRIGGKAEQTINEYFSPSAVGELIANRIAQIRSTLD